MKCRSCGSEMKWQPCWLCNGEHAKKCPECHGMAGVYVCPTRDRHQDARYLPYEKEKRDAKSKKLG